MSGQHVDVDDGHHHHCSQWHTDYDDHHYLLTDSLRTLPDERWCKEVSSLRPVPIVPPGLVLHYTPITSTLLDVSIYFPLACIVGLRVAWESHPLALANSGYVADISSESE